MGSYFIAVAWALFILTIREVKSPKSKIFWALVFAASMSSYVLSGWFAVPPRFDLILRIVFYASLYLSLFCMIYLIWQGYSIFKRFIS
jgi:hypothetical protein